MKRLLFIKKLICLTLAICMLFSLTACKKAEAQGQYLYVSAKGIGSATLKLKITGTFPEGTTPVFSYFDEESLANSPVDGLEQIISVTEKSLDEKKLVYQIKGLAAGTDDLRISFIKEDISYARVNVTVTVGDKLKFSDCVIGISETQDRYVLDGGVETNIIDDYLLDFSRDGKWTIESYDESLLDISGPYYDADEDETSWTVSGKHAGQSDITLVNPDDGKKIKIGVETYDKDAEEGEESEEGEIFVKVISSDEDDYEKGGIDIKEINQEGRIENLYLPGNYQISDVSEFDDEKSRPVIEMEMKNGDDFFFINAWGNKSIKDVRSEVTDKTVLKTLKSLTIAGIPSEYYNVSGVDIFLFEREGVVYLISFPKESDIEAHIKVIESINWVQ